jgi:hypothetical protein
MPDPRPNLASAFWVDQFEIYGVWRVLDGLKSSLLGLLVALPGLMENVAGACSNELILKSSAQYHLRADPLGLLGYSCSFEHHT